MTKANKELVKFIREARKRGFDDIQIKEPLLKNNWSLAEIEKAFAYITPKYKFKNKVDIYLDSDILRILEKRSKQNLFTISEQIEDIIRRSCITAKKNKNKTEKLDDLLVSIFSRKKK